MKLHGYSIFEVLTSTTIRVRDIYPLLIQKFSETDFLSVFLAYAVVTLDKTILFIDNEQVDSEVKAHLGDEVEIRPYESIFSYLSDASRSMELSKQKVKLVPPVRVSANRMVSCQQFLLGNTVSLAIAEAIGKVCSCLLNSYNPVIYLSGSGQCHHQPISSCRSQINKEYR